jgi:hypothetical protein
MPHKRRNMNFEKIIQDGENPLGFTAQTANGTAHWQGTGWNKEYDWKRPELEPDATRPAGRSNRTGE